MSAKSTGPEGLVSRWAYINGKGKNTEMWLTAKESREQEQESRLDGLRALLSEHATYVQVRQPMGESIQTRSFWTVLTG